MNTINHFDSDRAKEYDRDILSFIPGYELIHQSNIALASSENQKHKKILVVGAGTGKESISLASEFKEAEIHALEPSDAMFEKFKSKILEEEIKNIKLHNSYIKPLAETDFTYANSILVMHFLPDRGEKLDFLREIYKRLVPMSELLLVDFMKYEDQCQDIAVTEFMKNYQLKLSPNPEKIHEAHEKIKTMLHRITESRLSDLAEKAGFYSPIKVFQSFLVSAYLLRK